MAAVMFGPLAVSAHACPVQWIAATAAAALGAAHDGPCADMDAAPAHAQGNACESHCSDGIVGVAQPDIPGAAFTALPAADISVFELRADGGHPGAALVAVSRAPPLTLQFCRLLI